MSQQLKERPASVLRAVFAGLGSLLSVIDKVRAKPIQAPKPVAAVRPIATREPPLAPEPEPVMPEPVAPEPEPAVMPEPEPVAPEPEGAAETPQPAGTPVPAAKTETAAALPLANYDELSLASLRARLRTLSVAQLTELLDYERNHAVRADVISMFERRIAKVQAES